MWALAQSPVPNPYGGYGYWGTNSYVGNLGGPADFPASFSGAIVPYGSDANGNNWAYASNNCGPLGAQSFTDGMSNTALFSEKLIGVILAAPIPAGAPNALRGAFVLNGQNGTPNLPVKWDTNNATEATAFAKAKFDRPSVFARVCPHEIDALVGEANVCRDMTEVAQRISEGSHPLAG